MENTGKYVVKYTIKYVYGSDSEKDYYTENQQIIESEIEFTDNNLLKAREKAFIEAKKIEETYKAKEGYYICNEEEEDTGKGWKYYEVGVFFIFNDEELEIYNTKSCLTPEASIFENLLAEYSILKSLNLDFNKKKKTVMYINKHRKETKGTYLENEMDLEAFWDNRKITLYREDTIILTRDQKKKFYNELKKCFIEMEEAQPEFAYKTKFKLVNKMNKEKIEVVIKTPAGIIPEEIENGIYKLIEKWNKIK